MQSQLLPPWETIIGEARAAVNRPTVVFLTYLLKCV